MTFPKKALICSPWETGLHIKSSGRTHCWGEEMEMTLGQESAACASSGSRCGS